MISASLSSSVVPVQGTLTAVVQSASNALVSFTFPAAFNPFGTSPSVSIRSSPDNSTWTIRGSGSIGLNGGDGVAIATYIAFNEYYQVSQIISGVQGPWSASLRFTASLATEPITPPTSVTITDVTRPFGDRYRIFFTVVQPSTIAGFSGIGLRTFTTWGAFNKIESFTSENLPSGSTLYTIDLLGEVVTGAAFQITIYNQAGGYESTGVTSVPWTSFIEEETLVEVLTSGDVEIPEWATSYEYWLYGGGGGGGGGLQILSETAIELISGGDSGSSSPVQTAKITSWVEDELTLVIGAGGLGRGRISGVSDAEPGGLSRLLDGAITVATSPGGAIGLDGTFGDYIEVGPAGGPGRTSQVVAAIAGVHSEFPGAPGITYDKDNPFELTYSNSPRVTGGSGGNARVPGGTLVYPSTFITQGGDGGPGICYIRFRNY